MIDYKSELNQAQYEVITKGDGYSLVLAGAGSGKTRTITYRVAYLIESGVPAENILLLTFTNKASREMISRVQNLISRVGHGASGTDAERIKALAATEEAGAKITGGTFHSVAVNILKQNAKHIGFPEHFSILDSQDSIDLMKLAMEEVGLSSGTTTGAGKFAKKIPTSRLVQNIVSFATNSGRAISEIVEERYENFDYLKEDIVSAAERYRERKIKAAVMDFDDLLVHLRNLLQNNPKILQAVSSKFKYILVDEFQDTNKIQNEIVDLFGTVHKNVLVVGDDAQSIYSFRAADINNILDFPKKHPGAKIFKLEDNYRSSKHILELANSVIGKNKNQFKKTLKAAKGAGEKPVVRELGTGEDEARFIAESIASLKKNNIPHNEVAVLFRAAHHSQPLEVELMRRGWKYDYRGGLKFFERSHIKDILAFLRSVANPQDEIAWRRMLVLFEGVGPTTADIIFKKMASSGGAITEKELKDTLPSRAHLGVEKFMGAWKGLKKVEPKPHLLMETLIKGAYRNYLEEKYDEVNSRMLDLEQLAAYAKTSKKDLNKFLADASLQESYAATEEKDKGAPDERLVLSTIHQSKGLEWDAVFVINLINGQFPNERALREDGGVEEERRLFYVAATRARKHLFLTHPIIVAGGFALAEPSAFLEEIEHSLIDKGGRAFEAGGDTDIKAITYEKEGSFLSDINDL